MDYQDDSDPRALDGSAETGGDPTELSPGPRPNVLATPEQLRQRQAIAAALFGMTMSIGRYRVLNRLGEGGMGTVYAAFDDRLDRRIAIKLLRASQLDSAEARERTLREARALARLSHPNVVHVYEVGEFEDQLFVAMEFLAGPTLRVWLDDGEPRSWQERLGVMLQAGKGLAAAHAQGIIHRDFKPHNAMFGADGRVRVLDFGLASLGDNELVEDEDEPATKDTLEQRFTKTGAVLGTPAYMAPEQFEGGRADARSDQFGFCVALYEALYGQRPFQGKNLFELRIAVDSGTPKPPPAGSTVPTWLRKVVLRGLARDPAHRFASMQALLDALADDPAVRRRKGLVAAMLLALVGGGTWGLSQAQAPDDPTCRGASAELEGVWDDGRRAEVEAAIEATKLSYATATRERVEQRLDEYTEQWVAARIEACEASQRGEQSDELLDLRMACLDERLLHVRATVDVLAAADATVVNDAVQAVAGLPGLERCSDVDALTAEVPPPEDPEAAKRVAALDEQLVKARALQRTGQWPQGLAIADAVVSEAVELEYEPLLARAWLRQGDLQRLTGAYPQAEATLAQAHETAVGLQMASEAAASSSILVFVVGRDLARHADARAWARHAKPWARAAGTDEALASYLNNVGVLAESEGKYDEAREHHQQALAILEALGGDEPDVGIALNSLGNVAKSQAKYAEAREYYQRALVVWERTLGPEHPTVAKVIANLGSVAHADGNYAEANEYLLRSLAIYEKALGPEHPDITLPLTTLGEAAWREGKYDESRQYQERALAIKEKAFGPDHKSVAISLGNLGMLARKQGKFDEARGHLLRAQTILETTLGPEHPRIAVCSTSLGNLAHDEGKFDEAREHHQRALAIWTKAMGPEHSDVGIALGNLGNLAYLAGDYEDAREHYERALAIFEKALGPDHPNVAFASSGLGRALLGLDRPEEALPPLERALAIETAKGGDPMDLAATRFALARALWEVPVAAGRDRSRAVSLAEQARDTYRDGGKLEELQEIETWLTARS
jgi:tetratricopeptide (TPR) repeat protein/tRNA A-37 threonylcarbamoyl transferase component Bud32